MTEVIWLSWEETLSENHAEQTVYLPRSRKCLCGGGFWKSLVSSDACEDGLWEDELFNIRMLHCWKCWTQKDSNKSLFYLQQMANMYLNTSRSVFQILYFYAVLLLQQAPYSWDGNIYFYSYCRHIPILLLLTFLNCGWSATLITHIWKHV